MTYFARKFVLVAALVVLLSLIVSCATTTPPPQTAVAQATLPLTETPTESPTQTETAVLTPTPTPTSTHTPTATALPTKTTRPTDTPLPTLTASPEPTVISTPLNANAPPTPKADIPPEPPANAGVISLADLPAHIGEEITVSGQVVATASFSQGFKFTLDDGAGRADLLLWHNVYDDAWDAPQLNIGATVQATGKVGQFDGAWQVEPDFGGDVQVITPGGAAAPARPIGELSSHVGETAQISGAILRLESSSSAVKIFVGDETGEIVVFVWRTILDRIPNKVALGEVGTRVRINGRVENYRSNLELTPALPYDVEVLP